MSVYKYINVLFKNPGSLESFICIHRVSLFGGVTLLFCCLFKIYDYVIHQGLNLEDCCTTYDQIERSQTQSQYQDVCNAMEEREEILEKPWMKADGGAKQRIYFRSCVKCGWIMTHNGFLHCSTLSFEHCSYIFSFLKLALPNHIFPSGNNS